MTNPFVALYETPAETLLASAYALVLVGVLLLTWWALGRNALWLTENYRDGWLYLIPLDYALRAVAALVLLAVDLAVLAAIVSLFA